MSPQVMTMRIGELSRRVGVSTHVLRAWHPDFPVGAAALEQALVVGGSPLQTTLRVAG